VLEARTDQGSVRKTNQDAAAAARLGDGSCLLVVADGVGGYPGGEVAAQTAVDTVVELLRDGIDGDPGEQLRDAFAAANERVREGQTGEHEHMSTTLVVAWIRDREAWIAHLGDSRAYLVVEGEAERLTRDHSWVEDEIAAGRLQPDEPAAILGRNLITRSIGFAAVDEPEVRGPLRLQDGAIVLLCSDGLHGVLDDETIARVSSEADDGTADALVAAVLERGAHDNIAVALTRV